MTKIRETYLECTTGGHNKFYLITTHKNSSDEYIVIITYGPIGANGRSTTMEFLNRSSALAYHSSKRNSKVRPTGGKEPYFVEREQDFPTPVQHHTAPVQPKSESPQLDWSKAGPVITWG